MILKINTYNNYFKILPSGIKAESKKRSDMIESMSLLKKQPV